MNISQHDNQGFWSSRLLFVLAVTGATVGLGNIWRFPYMVSEYGGGLFILVYLFFIALIGIPVLMAEIMLGRMGRHSPITGLRIIAEQNGLSRHWQNLGWMATIAGLLILSFYSVIAGWSIAFIFRMAAGVFDNVSAQGVSAIFGRLVGDPEKLLAWHTLFMMLVYVAVSRGLHAGLERTVKILMPALFLVLLLLLAYAIYSGHFTAGVQYMFSSPTEHLDSARGLGFAVLAAMGQAFFTLSLGAGAIMAYAAYLPRSVSIAGVAVTIVLLDTVIAITAGMIIFPLIFANDLGSVSFSNGLDARYGPGLVFQTLPLAFGQMPGGALFGSLFFVLLVLAAWTSAIALMEPSVAYLTERWAMKRRKAAKTISVIAWLIGLGTIFSFNIWSDYRPLSEIAIFSDKTTYHLLDFLASNILLPLSGLLIIFFAGWKLSWKTTEDELSMGKEYCGYAAWRIVARYITPLLLIIVFIYSLSKALGRLAFP